MAVIKNIHDFMEGNGLENSLKVVTDTLYGFNHTKQIPMLPSNKDYNGYTFFTRPQLNLTDDNIRNIRGFYKFLSNSQYSSERLVRLLLDPRLAYGMDTDLYKQTSLDSPLVDKYNVFLPVLSNTLETLSGWPDIVTPTYTSAPGLRKEQWAMVDGAYSIYDVFELTATFKNFAGEPTGQLFELWNRYPSLVFEGLLNVYNDFLLANEFDYNTRIYRFITDESGRFIKKSATTGASFPTGEATGKVFDFNRNTSYSDQTKSITTKFISAGAVYNDDISLLEFNTAVATFNPMVAMYLKGNKKLSNLEKIPYDLLPAFNNRGYPVINLDTNELEWLIDKTSPSYQKIVNILVDNKETKIYV